jgi:hypothetical protein
MQNHLKATMQFLNKLSLIDGLIVLVTVSLVIMKAAWPLATAFIVLGSLKGLKDYRASIKVQEKDDSLKDRLAAVENKMAMMGLRK